MEDLRDTIFSNTFNQLPIMARVISKAMIGKRRRKFRKIEANKYHPI